MAFRHAWLTGTSVLEARFVDFHNIFEMTYYACRQLNGLPASLQVRQLLGDWIESYFELCRAAKSGIFAFPRWAAEREYLCTLPAGFGIFSDDDKYIAFPAKEPNWSELNDFK